MWRGSPFSSISLVLRKLKGSEKSKKKKEPTRKGTQDIEGFTKGLMSLYIKVGYNDNKVLETFPYSYNSKNQVVERLEWG